MGKWESLAVAVGFAAFFGYLGFSAHLDNELKIAKIKAESCNK